MDLLAQLFAGGTPGPDSDFWYQPVGTMTAAGIKVDPEGAKKISAWYRGRDLLATSTAMLPLKLMEITGQDGSEPAYDHPLYDALQRQANIGEDAFQWRRQQMYDLIDYGHGYSWLEVGRTWSLERINPTLVTPERIKKGPSRGRTLFHVRDEQTGQTTVHTQDEIFHLCGAEGKGVLEAARESLGLAAVTEKYAGNIFSSGTLNSGVIEVPAGMKDEQKRAMAQSWVTAQGRWGFPKILEPGTKWFPNDVSPENMQMLLSRKFSVNDIARWLGLPPHMLGDLDRATFSNIEHQAQEFVTYSLGGWLSLIEFAANNQLVLQPNRYYVEFTREALVRGDISARWQAYQIAVSTGVVTRNEVRKKENLNPLAGLDTPLEPAGPLGGKQPKSKGPTKVQDESASAFYQRAEAIAQASAARLLRKEVATVQRLAVRHSADGDAFAAAVSEFYAAHAALVSDTLQMSEEAAGEYCATQAASALAGWLVAVETWGTEAYAAGLAGLALEEAA